jgi:hypothetical protein
LRPADVNQIVVVEKDRILLQIRLQQAEIPPRRIVPRILRERGLEDRG